MEFNTETKTETETQTQTQTVMQNHEWSGVEWSGVEQLATTDHRSSRRNSQ
ncbi:GH17678 [Drosophila grimshawi]|uniref:GH17678 n=1 Tax=Drosophila grimshawi TaxID=7222 RepID=B4JWW0_DROGR|nr:GH17678 [Drosophila grimshawi]